MRERQHSRGARKIRQPGSKKRQLFNENAPENFALHDISRFLAKMEGKVPENRLINYCYSMI